MRTAADSNYARCTACGAMFLDPMPAPAILAREYNVDGPDACRDLRIEATPTLPIDKPDASLKLKLPFNGGFASRLHREIQAWPNRSPRVLDIGFGSGAIVEQLIRSGVDAYGIDMDSTHVERLKARYPDRFITADVLRYTADKPYDLMYSTNFLEHIVDPVRLFRHLGDQLSEGGLVLFMTPNAASIDRRVFGTNWYQLWFPQHVVLHTPRSIRLALALAGLALDRLWTLGSPGTSWALSARRALRSVGCKLDSARATRIERLIFCAPALLAAGVGHSSELVVAARRTRKR